MIDYNFLTEKERENYIKDAILNLDSLNELLDMFKNLLNNEKMKNDHLVVAWLINNLKESAVESMEKSLVELN